MKGRTPGDVSQLAGSLIHAVNQYLLDHDLTDAAVVEALRIAIEAFTPAPFAVRPTLVLPDVSLPASGSAPKKSRKRK